LLSHYFVKGIVHFVINFWYVLAYLKGIQDVESELSPFKLVSLCVYSVSLFVLSVKICVLIVLFVIHFNKYHCLPYIQLPSVTDFQLGLRFL